MNNVKYRKILILFLLLAVIIINASTNLNQTKKASAANFSVLSDTLSRNKAGELSSHSIAFYSPHDDMLPGESISVDFHEDEGGFLVDGSTTTAEDFDYNPDGYEANIVGVDGQCSGHTGMHDAAISINDSTGILTITHCYSWVYVYNKNFVDHAFAYNATLEFGSSATTDGNGVDRVTNPSAGSYTIDVSGSWGDSGKLAVLIATEDQVGVSAIIDPILSFSISNATIGFGSFVSPAVRYATSDLAGSLTPPSAGSPTVISVSTNIKRGLYIMISDTGNGTGGLWSPAPISGLIPPSASSYVRYSSKTFGIYGKNASGLVISSGFDNNGISDQAISSTQKLFASSTSPIANGTVDLVPLASVNMSTKAGVYSDTIILVCTGLF